MIPALGIGPLGVGEWSVPGNVSAQAPTAAAITGTPPASGAGSFSGALSSAIDSLDSSQTQATQAAQQLATGQLTDPAQAITAVENAQLMMDFASTVRNQLSSAATTMFNTQV